MFQNVFSVQRGYLYGPEVVSRHCEEKVKKDVVILRVQFDKITVAQSMNKRITSLLDQVGLIGECFTICMPSKLAFISIQVAHWVFLTEPL